MSKRRNSDTNFSVTGTSNISSYLMQRANNARDGSDLSATGVAREV
jgi:hypothetical protein